MIGSVINFISLGAVVIVSAQPESCPHGWIQRGSSCYAFINDVKEDWMVAMSYCNGIHAKLVEIETVAENEFIRLHLMDNNLQGEYMIGLSDVLLEGDWVWTSSQTNPIYSDWYPGQPDNYHTHEDCAILWREHGYHWNDAPCTVPYNFICEKELSDGTDIIG
ncbi:perlucin-like [Ostrea edulis]|uniref:perlucin-like n=1 Tax=Ostrea edulis TaxID=37623 RepID=UPI0024AF35AF|nr:perlucin-like [Ostrea edulis]